MSERLAEWIIASFSLALSALLFFETFGLPRIAADPGGLALMPRIFAVAAASGAALVLGGLVLHRLGPEVLPPTRDDGEKLAPGSAGRLAGVAILTVLYPFVMLKLGFLLSTALFLASVLTILRARWLPATLLSIVCPVVLYFLFSRLLNVYLPSGQWVAGLLG